jgi:hypothetical protein
MVAILSAVVSIFAFRFRGRASLELELVALRHQVTVLRRQRPGRLQLSSLDRLLWVWLYRIWPQVIDAMVLVKPATVVQWHRKGLRLYWRWRSRRPGRPKISTEIRDLIRRMSRANPLWGAPRIHGELLKLGIEISQATVGRWMPWRPKVPSPTWRTFLRNHLARHCGDRHVCGCHRDVPAPLRLDCAQPSGSSVRSAVNAWITLSSSASVTCAASCRAIFNIIMSENASFAQQGLSTASSCTATLHRQ